MNGPPDLIVAVDPGLSTGLAALLRGERHRVAQGPPDAMLREAEDLLREAGETDWSVLLVVERFVPARGRVLSHQPEAQQVVGAVEDLGRRYGVPVRQQAAGDAVRLAPNDVLRRLGLLSTGRDVGCPDANDANSAVRHALLALSRKHATRFEELYGWLYDSLSSH